MKIFTTLLAIVFSIFSTAVMSYVSMAIPIGPWIAPTLALIGIIIFFVFNNKNGADNCAQIAFATFSGSIGGILATALGFYFTAIYFLDKEIFKYWMENPFYFSCLIGGLSIVSGLFGMWVANIFENKLLVQENLAFPVGTLVQRIIYAQKNIKKSIELIVGFVSNTIFCALQSISGKFFSIFNVSFFKNGFIVGDGIIPKSINLISKTDICLFNKVLFEIPAIRFDLWPMLWALGFVTGHVIAVPLLVGLATKIFFVKPVYNLAFFGISWQKYIITFCSGMAISTAIVGILRMPKELFLSFKNLFLGQNKDFNKTIGEPKKEKIVGGELSSGLEIEKKGIAKIWHSLYSVCLKKELIIESIVVIALFVSFMTFFGFTILEQVYTFVFAFICVYQISVISGKIGLATMGKFATFVTVPAIFLFPLNYFQIILMTAFIGVSGGVASDILFGRKMASISHISSTDMKKYQYLGIFISAIFVGFIFWLLINHFGLGSEKLFALRAQNRWMLIDTIKNAGNFNYYVIFLGIIFGFVLSRVKISPLLVLGGLFMPENITIGLIFGGLISLFVKSKDDKLPFWSGVYVAGSVWMLIEAIF